MRWPWWLGGRRATWPAPEYRAWSHLLYGVHAKVLESGQATVVVKRNSVRDWLSADVAQELRAPAELAFDEAMGNIARHTNRITSGRGTTEFEAIGAEMHVRVTQRCARRNEGG